MSDMNVKKRGWVKNAAIIFLSVLLVLTFYSSTIMNRSLPEVAAQYVQSGTLSVQIRGTGTVTATESFEVKSAVSRKVLSVPVKVGDTVSIGDTLVLFSEAESEDLKAAQDALDSLVLSYQKSLINAASGAYSSEKRAVQSAQDTLDEAKEKREANIVSDEELTSAENAVNIAKAQVAIYDAALSKAEDALSAFGTPTEGTVGDYSKVAAARNKLDALKLLYKAEIDAFNYTVSQRPDKTVSVVIYSEYLAMKYAKLSESVDEDEQVLYGQSVAYYAIKGAEEEYNSALKTYNENTTSGNMAQYNQLVSAVSTAKSNAEAANKTLKAVQEALDKLLDKREAHDAADAEVVSAQKTLDRALEDLEKSIALENLDFREMQSSISDQRALVESMKTGGESSVVTSLVNGIVTAVNVSAGNTTTPESTLMMVEVPDMGYTVSFPVTTEQSQKVREGDIATVLYTYWGANITATLAAIRSNPENPMTSKILVFKVAGDVTSGSQLTISVGERGASYSAIVPNSAVRSDSNGDFVLVVEAKSTALGNRYKAARVDVQVLAKDDTSSAVSGGLSQSDFVITSSSKPIEPGMQVRLPD